MPDSLTFAVDVFRTVCDRLRAKAADLRLLIEDGYSFEEWLAWEAYLACKFRQESYPFSEVTAKPTYASEGVATESGDPDRILGDLRVGGPNDGADHCWLFAELALLHDGNRAGDEWRRAVEADVNKLKRLGWKKSAALLIVVAASQGDVLTEWGNERKGYGVWSQPALTDPFDIALPGGGSVVVKAFDIKHDPAHTLTKTAI